MNDEAKRLANAIAKQFDTFSIYDPSIIDATAQLALMGVCPSCGRHGRVWKPSPDRATPARDCTHPYHDLRDQVEGAIRDE